MVVLALPTLTLLQYGLVRGLPHDSSSPAKIDTQTCDFTHILIAKPAKSRCTAHL